MSARGWILIAALAAGCGGGGARAAQTRPAAAGDQLGPPARLEDLRGDLVDVQVTGMSKERAARARDGVAREIGQPYDAARAGRVVKFVAALSGVADVVAEARPKGGGVALRLRVKEHPRIRTVDVRGSHAVPASEWLTRMGIKEGDFLDPVLVTSRRHDMLETLRSFGHFSADVAWAAPKAPDGRVDLVFTIEEGPAVVLSKVDFRGNKAVKRDKLLDILAKNGGSGVGARYWRGALANALLHLNAHYFDIGHINVQIDEPVETLSPDRTSMAVVITIREGDRFRLGKLDARGALLAPAREYVKLLGVKPGEVFNRSKVAKGLERIGEMHKSKGQPGVEAVPLTEIDARKKTVAITVEVQGPPR